MSYLVGFIQELFFRIKLYLFGVTFYEVQSKDTEITIYTKRHQFEDNAIELDFTRETCIDLILKRGKIATTSYFSYTVRARMIGTGMASLAMLDGRRFFFNGRFNSFGLEEHKILELISDIYIDFAGTVQRVQ